MAPSLLSGSPRRPLSANEKVTRRLLVVVVFLLFVVVRQEFNLKGARAHAVRSADVSATAANVQLDAPRAKPARLLAGHADVTPEPPPTRPADVSGEPHVEPEPNVTLRADVSGEPHVELELLPNDELQDTSLPAIEDPQWDDVSSCLRDELTTARQPLCWGDTGQAHLFHITDELLPALNRLEAKYRGEAFPWWELEGVHRATVLANPIDYETIRGPGKQATWSVVNPPASDGFLHVLIGKVPCALHGCCGLPWLIRPNSTDLHSLDNHFVYNENRMFESLQGWAPQYILDAGGVGMAAAFLALLYPDAKVLHIEPHPDNFDVGARNAVGFPNIKQVNMGLWSRQTTLQMCDRTNTGWDQDWPFESDKQLGWFSREPEDPSCEEMSGEVAVEAIEVAHLSNLMKAFNFPRFDLIKMDIEGAEARVFQGSWIRKMLSEVSLIVCEVHPWYWAPERVHQVFKDIGGFRNFRYWKNEVFVKPDLFKC